MCGSCSRTIVRVIAVRATSLSCVSAVLVCSTSLVAYTVAFLWSPVPWTARLAPANARRRLGSRSRTASNSRNAAEHRLHPASHRQAPLAPGPGARASQRPFATVLTIRCNAQAVKASDTPAFCTQDESAYDVGLHIALFGPVADLATCGSVA